MPALSQNGGSRQAGRTGTDNRHSLFLFRGREIQFGLVAGAGVDQAGRALQRKRMIEAGLVAGDAGVDLLGVPGRRLVDEIRVSEKRPRHRNHVGITTADYVVGDLRVINAVGGYQRQGNMLLHPRRDPGESRPRYAGGNGRHARFVPADTGVQQGCAGCFQCLAKGHNLFPTAAFFNQVDHRQAEDNNELFPHCLPHGLHNFNRQSHPVGESTAPLIITLVGSGDQELVDEIAFRTHDLDTIVTCPLR